MKLRRYLVILGMALLAQGAFAPPAQSQLDWTFSANYTAAGDDFSCSNVPFTVPSAGGSTSLNCDVATVNVTVNISGLSFSVGGFGDVSFDGITCLGTGGGSSSITVTGTGSSFSTGGTISGNGVCTSNFGDFPFTVSGTYNASGGTSGALSVSPTAGLNASGDEGGPFSPPSQSYTLRNTGGAPIVFGVSKSSNWVSLSKTGGTLSPGASTSVLVAINSNATLLDPGIHSDTVNFTNTTNGLGNTPRSVNLTVNARETIGNVTSVTGDVRIRIDGREQPLTSTTAIPDGAEVITGADGRVTLTFPEGSQIVLEPNSKFQLASPDDGCTWLTGKCLKQFYGKIRALISCTLRGGGRYCARVRATRATAAVRGTDFLVEHNRESNRTTITVFEGIVDVFDENSNLIKTLNAGETITLPLIINVVPILDLLILQPG